MKEIILKSLGILQFELPYILVLAMFSNILFNIPPLVILFGVMGFILQVIIYSRGVELVRDGNVHGSNFDKFRIFFGDFFIVTIILFSPLTLLIFAGGTNLTWLVHGMGGVISLASVYVVPYLFLKRTRVSSILQGINFLKLNFVSSLPLLGLTVFRSVIELLARPLFLTDSDELKTGFSILIIGYVVSLVSIIISLVVFYTACMVLLKQEDIEEKGG